MVKDRAKREEEKIYYTAGNTSFEVAFGNRKIITIEDCGCDKND